jgi:hypothetical protein
MTTSQKYVSKINRLELAVVCAYEVQAVDIIDGLEVKVLQPS